MTTVYPTVPAPTRGNCDDDGVFDRARTDQEELR
jgi:hypothetical protein